MALLERFQRGKLKMARIVAFSDGVFAVVVTLLVLELRVPGLTDARSAAELAHKLAELAPKLVSWLASFIIVAKFWLNHHHLMDLPRRATYGTAWLNSLFLMVMSMTPFPTALIGEYPWNPLGLTVFGCVMALGTLAFLALQAYIARHAQLHDAVGRKPPPITAKSWLAVGSYLLGAALGWVYAPLAFVMFFLTPLFFITPPGREAPA